MVQLGMPKDATMSDARVISSRLTKVRQSLLWHEAPLTSERHRRLARKWPWAWRCTADECDDVYGAKRTEVEAQADADQHERVVHGWTDVQC